jgi:hypothetical protein
MTYSLKYLLLLLFNLSAGFVFSVNLLLLKDSALKSNPENFVLTSVSKTNPSQVRVKWYSKDFMYREGIVVYRKEAQESSWQKLNATPLKKGDYQPTAEELKQDKELKQYVELINAVPKLEGVARLGAYVKSFKSDAFSRYIGIEFIDQTVTPGKIVQYKVCALVSGIENEIGVSEPVLAGKITELLPPNEIVIEAKNKQATVKWLPETSRYYSVDIYRMFDSTGSDRIKITKDPIIISKNKNKNGVYAYPEKFYLDENLKEDTVYYYSFKTIDFFGEESDFCKPIRVFIKDLNAPLPPYFMGKMAKHKQVILKWHKSDFEKDFTGFNIYRAKSLQKEYTLVNKTLLTKTDSIYTDSVSRYGMYRYVIASMDRSGNEGVTEEIPVETVDEIPPAIPKGLVIKSDTGRIELTWEQNKEDDLWGYLVYQTINKNVRNDQYVLITPNPVTNNVFKQSLAKNSKNKFLYRVLSVDSTYNKSELSEFAVTTLPDVVAPAEPFISNSYIDKDKNIVIEFFKNTELDLKGYQLYRVYKEDEEEKTEQVNAKLIDKTSMRYIDRSFENYGAVNYYLVAIDSTNNTSKRSNIAKLNIKKEEANINYEFKSLNTKALKLPNSWQIKWKMENPGELFYVVYTRRVGEQEFEPQTKNLSDTKCIVNLKNGRGAYVQVRAYNIKGLVAKSEIKLLENKK